MELSYIKKIIRLVENSEVDEVEIEEEGKKIRVAKHRPPPPPIAYAAPPLSSYPPAPAAEPPAAVKPVPVEPEPPAGPEVHYHEVRSPIVGTFYRAPSPDADPYVEVGQKIRRGDVLCIVEAMKLMNEIESDVDGDVVKILVENAKPVEYNQILFLIKPS
jgi:acetyl-CoA carboxylase biotin carboxyl carrier protein